MYGVHTMKILIVVGLMAFVSACSTGANFPAAKSQEFILGVTTKQQVIDTFGKPQKEEVTTKRQDIGGKDLPTSMVLTTLHYDYSEPPGEPALASGFRPWRRAFLYFHENKLVGIFRASNFKADSTRFAIDKVSEFQKGKTTEQDVVAALGQSSGRGIYPLALQKDGRALFYNFVLPNHPPGSTTTDDLRVFVSADGIVQDFALTSNSKANPVAPAPVIIPIYIPAR